MRYAMIDSFKHVYDLSEERRLGTKDKIVVQAEYKHNNKNLHKNRCHEIIKTIKNKTFGFRHGVRNMC